MAEQLASEFVGDKRLVYTFLNSSMLSGGASPNNDLTVTQNLFKSTNTRLTPALLGVGSEAERLSVLTTARNSNYGPIIHSEPLITTYANGKSYIFVGSNEGFLHCIDDSTGKEVWAFVMPDHLATIQHAPNINPIDGEYYVDGMLGVKTIGSKKILIFGARRGAESYIILDITDVNKPLFVTEVKKADSGQSWGYPTFRNISKVVNTPGGMDAKSLQAAVTQSTYNNFELAAILAGGYDSLYDTYSGSAGRNAKGAAIFGINPLTGSDVQVFQRLNRSKSDVLEHSIVDFLFMDSNIDGIYDTFYFGDLGGNLNLAVPFTLKNDKSAISGSRNDFEPYKLLQTSGIGFNQQRKIMFAPDVTIDEGIQYVCFGTGDRENPLDLHIENNFYCVFNKDVKHWAGTKDDTNFLTNADLYDATDNLVQDGDDTQKTQAKQDLQSATNYGWYIKLAEGEKVLASPTIYGGVVYFTTFQPQLGGGGGSDACAEYAQGTARLYAVNYKDGSAARKWDETDDTPLTKSDRSYEIGTTPPSKPVISVDADGSANVFTSVDSFIDERDAGNMRDNGTGIFYWKQVF